MDSSKVLTTLLVCAISFLLFSRVRGQLEDVWSGFVNDNGGELDFLCPNNSILTGLASDFSGSDRRWEFRCGTAERLASTAVTCTLQSPINDFQEEFQFSCPNDGYLGGLRSVFRSSSFDRQWQPYCCNRPFSSLVNCQFSVMYENQIRGNLNSSAPSGHVVAGLDSFYFSRDRRWRFQTCQIEVNCGDPGVPNNGRRFGDNFFYTNNVTFVCDDGYYQSAGPVGGVRTCLISGEWSDEQPVCTRCGHIENCAQVLCTNSSDHFCQECKGNHMVAMAYSNLRNQCEARCSWLRAFCFPGVCPDTPTSCMCLDGFAGPNCLQITELPDLSQCSLTLQGAWLQLPTNCRRDNQSSFDRIFTNIVPDQISGVWLMAYTATNITSVSIPPYVRGYDVGVALAELSATVYRAANPSLAVSQSTHVCPRPYLPDDPVPGPNMCNVLATPTSLANHTFLHGDTLELQVRVQAGGYLDINNLDTGEDVRHYYQGMPSTQGRTFVIDLQPPIHCSQETPPTCINPVDERFLSLSGAIVQSTTVGVSWGGWTDIPSGIQGYQLILYHLEEYGGFLREGAIVQITSYNHTEGFVYEDYILLPQEGPFSFVLETLDEAGNVQYARRTVLLDNSSQIAIDPAQELIITSAVVSSNYLWQNSTTLPVVVDVRGHFYNTHFTSSDLLAPLGNFSAPLREEYDQPLAGGEFPRVGIPNSLGVVRLRYDYQTDQSGGTTLDPDTPPQPLRFSITPELLEVGMSPQLQDGDSVRVWFEAQDYRSQTIPDSVLVHVDSSAPVLSNLMLVRYGVAGLRWHWSDSLSMLEVQFDVSDPHSGVLVLEWSIGNETGASDVGQGSIAVSTVTNCSMSQDGCVCDILGRCVLTRHQFSPLPSDLSSSVLIHHDATYYLTVMATNHAYLSSSASLSFIVDTTPPLGGVVIDGLRGVADLDYQQNSTLRGWWEGFVDRESAVLVYQYGFSRSCLNASHFTYPLLPESVVTETTKQYASSEATGEGTYYLTVVAWNSALSSSPPVCSDGITVDVTPPIFMGVSIPGIISEGGLVQAADGEVWLVGADRTRRLVEGGRVNSTCTSVASSTHELSTFPIGQSVTTEICLSANPLPASPLLVTTQSHTLNVTWAASDNIGMRDFYVALYSLEEFNNIAELRTVPIGTRTGGFSHLSLTNSNLLRHGNSFYLVVRGEDVTGFFTTVSVGPVLVDQTPPTVNGSVYVEGTLDHVMVMWDSYAFSEPEEGDETISLRYAIGLTRYGEEVASYQPLPFATPTNCPRPSTNCSSIPTSSLSLVSGQTYHFTLSVSNTAGLVTLVAASNIYRHTLGPPAVGIVLDQDPTANLDVVGGVSYHRDDIDVIFDGNELGIRWKGFSHASEQVDYFVMLGTVPSLGDVVPETFLGPDVDQFIFRNLSLDEGSRYFGTVVAVAGSDRVNASSNGVTYLGSVSSLSSVGVVWDGIKEEQDSDSQSSTSQVAASWSFPGDLLPFISHYMWAVVVENVSRVNPTQQTQGNSSWESGSGEMGGDFEVVAEYVHVGKDDRSVRFVPGLEAGPFQYHSAVRPCITSTCLPAVYSDGFYVATPPVGGVVRGVFTPLGGIDSELGTSLSGQINVSWAEFSGPDVRYYEWQLMNNNQRLLPWSRVERGGALLEVSKMFNGTVSLHRTLTVQVRAINSAGLYGSASAQVEWNVNGRIIPQYQVPRSPLQVYDVLNVPVSEEVVSSWREVRHVEVVLSDVDFINCTSLSARWPSLSYTEYLYSVATSREFMSCSSLGNVACGSTHLNYATVTSSDIQNGQTYYFCVRAHISNAIHPTGTTPSTLEVCSNGVTVDLAPPLGSCLKIVDALFGSVGACSAVNESVFQASTSELRLRWEEFQDGSGVADYSYAIGTRPYDSSVINYISVGVATSAAVRGLSLKPGSSYYATVRATDLVGHSSSLTSRLVTIDTTPPTVSGLRLEGVSQFRTSLDLEWNRIQDMQSGIVELEWSLGTRPYSGDLSGWNEFNGNGGTGMRIPTGQLPLYEGQRVFASVKVRNGAGLVTVASTWGSIMDSTPPDVGVVWDGPYSMPGESQDLDYWGHTSHLSAHWSSFTDPHSTVVGYRWAIGSCHGCSNIRPFTPVGLRLASSTSDLSLSHGGTYYVSVEACNSAGLCSRASSNGITVDVTPPTCGRVYDGPGDGSDRQYQTSPYVVSARWTGFHDTQSSLRHFLFFAGTSRNSSDIVSPVTLPATRTWHVQLLATPLAEGTRVFVTVVAYNGIGLSSRAYSNGVTVDSSPPISLEMPVIRTEWVGSRSNHTQLSSSSLRVEWNFTDNSAMRYYYLALQSDVGKFIPVPPQITFLRLWETFSRLTLSDGDTYRVLVRGCDVGGACSSATSEPVLVDSTPPIDGYFVVQGLNSNLSVQSWSNQPATSTAGITVAFFGFLDPHSWVERYWGRVGSEVSGQDLFDTSLLAVSPQDGGAYFTATLSLTRQLTASEMIHITLWAENGAGLESHAVHGSFIVEEPFETDRGSLTFVRSPCPVASCVGHCSCAARGDLCTVPATLPGTCQILNGSTLPTQMRASVYNVVPQLVVPSSSVYTSGRLVTSIADKLYGRWVFNGDLTTLDRVEWSVGVAGAEPGVGLMDMVSEGVWHESITSSSIVFAVSSNFPLVEFQMYVFHVRVWYSSDSYAIFTSVGVIVDFGRPLVAQGRRVADILPGNTVDIDFTSSDSMLALTWSDVFLSTAATSYSTMEVGIGDTPGSDNVLLLTPVAMVMTSYLASGLDLEEGVGYYGVVRATNPLGETTVTVSDGVLLDVTLPKVGVVLSGSGRGYVTSRSQSITDQLSVRWFGFSDAESTVTRYEATITNSVDPPAQYDNVSISLWTSFTGLSLVQGQTYYAHVVAVNGAGLRSRDVVSEGMVVQTMPPVAMECVSHDEVQLSSPFFDNSSYLGNVCPREIPDVSQIANGWEILGSYTTVVSYSDNLNAIVPADGCHAIGIIGSASQSFPTMPGAVYILEFSYTGYHGNNLEEGVRVQLPGVDQLLRLPYGDGIRRWSRGRVEFAAEESTSRLTFSSAFTDSVVYLDSVRITTCALWSPLSPATVSRAIRLLPTVISGSKVKLEVEWNIVDEIVGIREYLWSIGTVSRGVQLQSYLSTGNRWRGTSEVSVAQGQEVFVAVVARGNSGLDVVINSTGYSVDLLSPGRSERSLWLPGDEDQSSLVWDGEEDVDVDYQSSAVVAVNWEGLRRQGRDDLTSCAWAIGSSPGSSDIQNFLILDTPSSLPYTMTSDLSGIVQHGSKVYSTLVCRDQGGLSSSFSTNGLTILLEPPSSTRAYVTITSPLYTAYLPRQGYLPSSALTAVWGGFEDRAGDPLSYEVRIMENGSLVIANWTDLSSARLLTVSELMLPYHPATHMVEVRARNSAGTYSEIRNTGFSIAPDPPVGTGTPVNDTWVDNSILELEWSESFFTPVPLYYELSIGVKMGSGSVLKWMEISSMETTYRVMTPYLFRDVDYFVTVTAISSAGLHASISQFIPGIPISGL